MRTWSERTPKPCGAACDVGTTRRADGNPRMEGHPSGTGSLRRQEADRVGKAASAGLEEESLKDWHWVIAWKPSAVVQHGAEPCFFGHDEKTDVVVDLRIT